jgi:hypothetical protein
MSEALVFRHGQGWILPRRECGRTEWLGARGGS